MKFWSQYRALLYKNWILWKRKIFGSLCEVLFPIGLIIVVYLIRLASPASNKSAQTYQDESDSSFLLSPFQSNYSSIGAQPPFRGCFDDGNPVASYSYAIISSDEAFKAYMIAGVTSLTSYTTVNAYYRDFASEPELEDYITGDSYEDHQKICFAVVFNHLDNENYELHLRFNTTNPRPAGTRRVGTFVDVFWLDSHPATDSLVVSPSQFVEEFYYNGLLSLSNLVDNYILTHTLGKTGGAIYSEVRPMRFPSYREDNFLTFIGGTLSFFIVISYLIPVCRLLSAIVGEKESKIKEMMMMMGLSNFAYWLSWITYYFVVYTFLAVILTIVSISGKVFTYSNSGLIFLFYWLFGLSCISFSIFLSMFFSKSRSAVLLGVPLFIGSYFVSFAVIDPSISLNKKTGASLLPTVALDLATTYLTVVETGQAGVQTSNIGEINGNYNFSTYLGIICVDIVYMALLAVYLDLVWPTEWGVKRPWYFLVTRNFWCPRRGRTSDETFKQEVDWGDAVEPVDSGLEAQKDSGKAMLVRNLTKRFSDKTAVENLNLDIYEGQIFALLGHNGAGKTTTLSMLTGLIPTTDGDMTVKGMQLSKDLGKLRTQLGVCPQHNVLFPDLTPEEHLYIFSVFKGETDNEKIKSMSQQKLSELELMPSADKEVQYLSGGQKRKLSLAIALIGDSPIILLDEPTSGMDLTARRHMWDMLKNNKSGKIIILTTHYMEEADVLADRIAIMSAGKLRCCGSSLFLKSRYGVGYYLTMVTNQDPSIIRNVEKIEEFVRASVNGSKLMMDANREITFQLPVSSTSQFVQFFDQLDSRLEELGLENYSISATTLEEVFLRVARGDDNAIHKETAKMPEEEDESLLKDSFVLVRDRQKGSLFFSHFLALLVKRIRATKRDVKALVFEIFIPVILIIVGLALMLLPGYLKDYAPYDLSISAYSQPQTILYSGANSDQFLSKFSDYSTHNTHSADNEAFSQAVLDSRNSDPYHMGAYYFEQADTSSHTYWYRTYANQTAYQASATYYHSMSNAIFQTLSPSFSLSVYNYPLPITIQMQSINGVGNGFLGSLIFSLGFSFIPTGIILLISKEREVNVKHQHMISGVSLFAYWSSCFLWDLLKHILPAVVSSLIILAFQIDIYTADSHDYGAMWVLIILAGISSAPFSYFLSFFFKNHSTAQIVMLIVSFTTGSVCPSGVFALYFFDSTRNAGQVLAWVLKIFPNFCFGWGVLRIGAKSSFASFQGTGESDAFDLDSAGGCIMVMGIITVVYFILVIIAQLFETNPRFARWITFTSAVAPEVFEHDTDVDKEAEAAEMTEPSSVPVNVKRIMKTFRAAGRTVAAVNEISFNVNAKECFALLGVNGAGKTTTFKMLTGEIPANSGSAFIGGNSVSTDLSRCRNLIGYCPQFDALTENLTGREHLELYAYIKGIPKSRVKEQVEYMLKHMDLLQYSDVLAGTYSGGNKRKLSVAMALIGNPSVVFLDEPSAGMDPEARKKMWKILGKLKQNDSAVILTTHSMEEAEALCDRMTIMVRGRLKCIGTCTAIKNKFGDGYELEIKLENPIIEEINAISEKISGILNSTEKNVMFENIDAVLAGLEFTYLKGMIMPVGPGSGVYSTMKNDGYITREAFASWCIIENLGFYIKSWLDSEFVEVEVIEHYHLMSKYKIKKMHVRSLGYLFSVIEAQKKHMKISDYAITMTSLEQIFNRFAKKAEAEELELMKKNQ